MSRLIGKVILSQVARQVRMIKKGEANTVGARVLTCVIPSTLYSLLSTNLTSGSYQSDALRQYLQFCKFQHNTFFTDFAAKKDGGDFISYCALNSYYFSFTEAFMKHF